MEGAQDVEIDRTQSSIYNYKKLEQCIAKFSELIKSYESIKDASIVNVNNTNGNFSLI